MISTFMLAAVLVSTSTAPGQSAPPGPKSAYSEAVAYEPLKEKVAESKSGKKKKSGINQPAEDIPPVVATTATINLPLSVFNSSGQFVPDISASELEVFVDNERVDIKELKGPDSPAEVVLLVDTSPSLHYSLEIVQKFLNIIVSQLRNTDRVTVADFDGKFRVILNSSTDRTAIGKAFTKLKFEDGTALYEAIDKITFDLTTPPDVEGKRVFVITDGVDTTSRRSSLGRSLANTLKSNAVYFPIYLDTFAVNEKAQKALGRRFGNIPGFPQIGNSQPIHAEEYAIGREYLTNLFRITGGLAFIFPATDTESGDTAKKVALVARSRYSVIIDKAKLTAGDEPKRVRVRINRPGLRVTTKSSFVVGP